MAPEYRIDYIRGYFDGDGSIYEIKKQNRLFFDIEGASKEVIYWIRDELVNHYGIYINEIQTDTLKSGVVMYRLKIGSIQELKKLYNLLYADNNLALQRKKEKFTSLLKLHETSIP